MAGRYAQSCCRRTCRVKASLLLTCIILLLMPYHPDLCKDSLHCTRPCFSANGFILSGASHASSSKHRSARSLRPDSAARLPLRAQPADFAASVTPHNLTPLLRFRPQPAESAEPGSTGGRRRNGRRKQAQHGEQAELRDQWDQRHGDQREGDAQDPRGERERTGAAAALEAAVEGSSLAVLPLADLIRAPRSAQQLEWQRAQQQQQQQQAGGRAAAATASRGVCPDFQQWGFFSPNAPSPHIHACAWRPMAADDTPTAALPVSQSSKSSESSKGSAVLAGLSAFMQQFQADRASGGGGAVGGAGSRAGGSGAPVGGRSVAVQQDCEHWKWLWPRPLVTRGEMCLDEDEVREFVEEWLWAEQEREQKVMENERQKERQKRGLEAINYIEAERGARAVGSGGGEEKEEEKGEGVEEEGMEVGMGGEMGGVVEQGGVVLLRDVFVDGRGVVFNASHVFSVHGACTSTRAGGRKRQRAAALKLKKSLSFPPGTPVSVHEHLVNLLPYEHEQEDAEEGGSEGSGGGEWVAQARVHSGGARGLVRLLPVLFLLASSLMPSARRFPILLNHRHLLSHLGPDVFGVDLAPLAIHHPSALLHGVYSSSTSSSDGSYNDPDTGLDPTAATTTGMAPHLFFARTLVLPIHTPSLCGLSSPALTGLHSSAPRAPDALWLALRGYHLLPPHGLPILSPNWTPRLPAPLQVPPPEDSPEDSHEDSPDGLVVGRALPEDWVVVVSVVWSTHVMEGGGGGEGVRETEAAMHVIIAMLKEQFSDGRVIVYDEHMPLLQGGGLIGAQAYTHACMRERGSYACQPSATTWHCQLAEQLGIQHYLSVCDPTWLDKNTGEQCHVDEVYATVLATVRRNPTLLALTGIPAISFPPNAFQPTPEPPTESSLGIGARPSDFAEAATRFRDFLESSLIRNQGSRFGNFSDFIPGSRLQRGTGEVAEFRRWAACVAERGEWRFNATPRVLPWAERGFDNCDLFHVRENGGLAGAAADAVALDQEMGREEREKAWKVRRAGAVRAGSAEGRRAENCLCRGLIDPGGTHLFCT
ncbi:unnamed protein product [Closterium sp. NIES-53]